MQLGETKIENFNFVVRPLKKLEENEAEIISTARQAIFKFSNYRGIYRMPLNNYLELSRYMEKQEELSSSEGDNISELKSNISRLMINYISSAVMFISHTEVNIKRRFGKKSREFSDWTKLKQHEHETNFAYRFMYDLRNYTQHIGEPINIVKNNKKIGDRELFAGFGLESLRESGFDWHEFVHEDLKRLKEEDALIFNTMNDQLSSLAKLYKFGLEKRIDELLEPIIPFVELIEENTKHQPILLHEEINSPMQLINSKHSILPFNEAIEVLKEYEEYKIAEFYN